MGKQLIIARIDQSYIYGWIIAQSIKLLKKQAYKLSLKEKLKNQSTLILTWFTCDSSRM